MKSEEPRRRWPLILLAIAVALVVVRLGGGKLADRHVRHVTGRETVGAYHCGNCHFRGGSIVPRKGKPHPDPFFLAAGPDADSAYVSQGPLGRVSRIDLSGRVEPQISEELGGKPRGLALSPDGRELAVALADADEVVFLDPVTLEPLRRVAVGVEPSGLAFAGPSGRLFVANARSGDVSMVDVAEKAEVRRIRAGREPFAVAASPDGDRIVIVSRMAEIAPADEIPASEVTILDPASGRVVHRILLESCHMGEAAAFTPDGRHVLIPTLRVRNLLPITQVARGWVMSGVLAVVDVDTGRVVLLPLGDPSRGFPDPSGIAVDPEGGAVWVGAGGIDEVARIDLDAAMAGAAALDENSVEDLVETRDYLGARFPVGRNPHGLLWTSSGLAVTERLDDTVSILGDDGQVLRRLPVGPPVPFDEIRRGDAVFHNARGTFQQAFSCRSCHPGGHTDGLTYDFDIDGIGRNIVLNRSLLGVRGTEPFKWIGLNPTLERQCGARFAMVLTRADPFPEPDLESLVTYLESLPAPRPVPDSGRIAGRETGAVERGRAIFERTVRKDGTPIPPQEQCTSCHAGSHYTNQLKANVGTQGPLDSTGDFDVPHLTGIASKAPYLHDGRALTLEAIWTAPGVLDQHGAMTDLNKMDLNDLVDYLRTL